MKTHYQAPNSLYTYCLRYLGNTCGQFRRPVTVVSDMRRVTCQQCRAAYARHKAKVRAVRRMKMVVTAGWG